MLIESWSQWLKRIFQATARSKPIRSKRPPLRFQPCLESLEERVVPAVLYDESASGDLSNNKFAPTARTLALGTNSVLGSVSGFGGDGQDWITLHLPSGMVLSSLVLK